MKIKLLLFGEAVNIPKTSIGLGVGLISVWVDDNGFTSASNDLGSLGYIFLETPVVDIGDVGEEKQSLFSNLHGSVVSFDIKPNLFVKSGGIARIGMTISVEKDGALVDQKIEFQSDDCTGVSVVSNALSFSTTMLQMEKKFAGLEERSVVADDELVAIADAAPKEGEEGGSQGDTGEATA